MNCDDAAPDDQAMLNDPRHTAIHEAAHAVIGRAMAQVCGGATIVPDKDEGTAGFSITHDPWQTVQFWDERGRWRDYRSIAIGRIITYLAGREAEEEILGVCLGGDEDDRYQVACMLEDITWPRPTGDADADRDAFLQRLIKKARMLVRRHRAAIEVVAALLTDRKMISGADVDAALARLDPGESAESDSRASYRRQ